MRERNYERARPYRKDQTDGELIRDDERSAKAKRDGPCLIRDGIRTTVDQMARAIDTSERRSSAGSFLSWLVELSKERKIQIFWDLFGR